MIGLIGVAGLMLCLTSCTPTELTLTFDAAIVAVDALVSSLSTSGAVDPGTATLITQWAGVAQSDFSLVSAELHSSDSEPLKISNVVKILSNLCETNSTGAACVGPPLPPGTASIVFAALQAASRALADFFEAYVSANTALSTPAAQAFFASHHVKLSWGDKQKLAEIDKKIAALKAKLAKFKH